MKIVIVYMDFNSDLHLSTIDLVKKILEKYNSQYEIYHRDNASKINFLNFDLVIIIGGDGTFLGVSHYIKETLMLGVNSDVTKKEGFFMQTDMNTFETVFKRIISNKYKVKKLLRLQCVLNGKLLSDLALNEFYIGSKHPYKMSRYILEFDNKKETHKSSGILIGTPSGSHAWIKSAGGNIFDSGIQLVAREPYDGKLLQHITKTKVLDKNSTIKITSAMADGIIVIDSLSQEYEFLCGDKLVISKGPELNYIE